MNKDEVLTTKEACQLLKVHRNTITRLVKRGAITPIIKSGGTRRFLKSDLLKLNN